jgi:hypothetical protein
MKTRFIVVLGITVLLIFSSCTNYLIPVESLKEQLSRYDSSDLVKVNVRGPMGEVYTYLANPIDSISCFSKRGVEYLLPNGPSVEMRVTYDNNRKAIYYFDRVFIYNDNLVGVQSRFITSIRKTIPLKRITKIEVQDGGKNFHYIHSK